MPELEGKTALVTGAGRGIGRAIALALAHSGAQVALTARTESQLRQTADLMGQSGTDPLVFPTDLTREDEVLALFDGIGRRLGRLDILVNNAGAGRYGKVSAFTVEAFEEVMGTNLRGTFLCCREALKLMIPKKSGYIINISSVVGFKGYPSQAIYTASKHGIMGLTKSLAAEVQEDGIRVSAILPGGVDTVMVRSARPDLDPSGLLHPDDIASAVLFLLSLSERAAVDQIYIRRRGAQPF